MNFRPPTLRKIGRYVCGDDPLPFPYRTSSQLTAFFTDLGLDYAHDASSRNTWAENALVDIGQGIGPMEPYSSGADAVKAILAALLEPTQFDDEPNCDLGKAIVETNKLLQSYGIAVVYDEKRYVCRIVTVESSFVSDAHADPGKVERFTFCPKIVDLSPDLKRRSEIAAVMMPYRGFGDVKKAIFAACETAGFVPQRADDIWDSSTFLDDIYSLILTCGVVIADFTERNPNVMYETGVAHTLGKEVVPITQNLEHIPSNLNGHRALLYLANEEGLRTLTDELTKKLRSIRSTLPH